jgi:thiamine-phosphate pyrophosphorylase
MQYDLYIVTDEKLSRGLTNCELTRRALAGGADVIQLRDKTCDCDYLLRCAVEMREDAKKAGALFIVNDRLDVALQCQADGVHIGQGDMPLKFARRVAPKGFIIGVSAGTLEEALTAEKDGADYIGFGPVFSTGSKSDAGPVCGLDLLKEVKQRVSIPVVAIGGINATNAPEVLRAGADGLAVISAVVSQDDVTAAAQHMKEIISQHRLAIRQ